MKALLHSRPFQASTIAALAVAMLGLVYPGTRHSPPPHNFPVEKLRIAVPALPYFALVYIAASNGYFAEEGLEVSLLAASHGVAAIGFLLDGKADLAVTAEVPFVISVMKGNALGIAAVVANASNDSSIIARRDHGIAEPHDLTGKKVGVSFGAGSSYFLWTYLIENKLSPESIVLVDLPPNRIVEALANGSVDAVATWMPISLASQAALGKNGLTMTNAGTNKTTVGVVGRVEFLKGHADSIEKLVQALLKAEQFTRSHREEAMNLVAKLFGVDVDVLRPLWDQTDFRVNLSQAQLTSMEGEARWAIARGYVDRRPIPNFLPNLYVDALLAARPERVTVIH